MTSFDGRASTRPSGRLTFEALISFLSARFVRTQPQDVDPEIEETLERIRGFFQVDRCGLLRIQQNRGFVYVSHAACVEGLERVPQELNLADLFYRLNVFPIEVPPPRERREGIPLLLSQFVRHFCPKIGKAIDSIPRRTMDEFQQHPWPGAESIRTRPVRGCFAAPRSGTPKRLSGATFGRMTSGRSSS